MCAQAVGEMLDVADFSPVRFSEELEGHIGLLRSQRTEFGFVNARKGAEKPMIEALQEDAAAMTEWLGKR